ncbi:apolipoprotein C-II [Aplochiton taeniatus]
MQLGRPNTWQAEDGVAEEPAAEEPAAEEPAAEEPAAEEPAAEEPAAEEPAAEEPAAEEAAAEEPAASAPEAEAPVAEEPEEQAPGTLARITDSVKSYYDHSVNTATGYLDNIRGLKLEEKAKNMYDDTTRAVTTYFGIMQDQVYHIFYTQ